MLNAYITPLMRYPNRILDVEACKEHLLRWEDSAPILDQPDHCLRDSIAPCTSRDKVPFYLLGDVYSRDVHVFLG